ncbi:MAG: uracil-DNA glycosylase [Rickettsiales bacterium]
MDDNISREEAIYALQWHKDVGIDETVSDAPINRLKEKETPAPVDVALATSDSRRLANEAATLGELREAVERFRGLEICASATRAVFADGVPTAPLMIVGEAPGAEEDKQGVPFCGASGQLLEKALNAVGRRRDENYYISNMVFWRPPANRKPTDEETEACLPFVEKHIALIAPKLLVLTGATAVQGLLKQKEGVTRLRGRLFDYQNRYMKSPVPALPIFHPSYLLRSPQQKKFLWRDMLAVEKILAPDSRTSLSRE